MKTDTLTLAGAMDVLSREIQCEDGVATSAIAEAAQRLRELELESAMMREALAAITRRVPIMASTGDYRAGQMHALEACSEVARKAIEGDNTIPAKPLPPFPWVASEQYGMRFILSDDNKIILRADHLPMYILKAMAGAATALKS